MDRAQPRLRQAVIAARELDPTIELLRADLGLGQPYHDAAVAYFGLSNAVFAVGDTFLEVVSPVDVEKPGAGTAARQLERSGRSACGYMVMFQVGDLADARDRARAAGVREVFEVELEDIAEVHLHPSDMRGAIVSLSAPEPPGSWRWGGEGWNQRSVPGGIVGVTMAVGDPDEVSARWTEIAGGPITGCRFVGDASSSGLVEIELELGGRRRTVRPAEIG